MENISRIAKASSHKLPGLSVKFKCPVPSRPVHVHHDQLDHHDHHDRGDHDDHSNHEEVGSYMRKLEVCTKGGCPISYNLWRLPGKLTISDSLSQLDIELL